MVKESAAYLGDRFWLPYLQPNPMEIMNWVHVETGQAGNLTWRRGQVNLCLIVKYVRVGIHKASYANSLYFS